MSAQRNFTISTPAPNVRADAEGGAEIVYTVANTSGLPNRAMARAVPLGDTRAEWLALEGQNEREFPLGGMHQFTVSAKFPPDASGRYSLRLDVLSARKGGEEAYAGPVVTIETTASAAPARPSRWWLWAAAVVLLLIVGVAGALVLRDKPRSEPPVVTDTAPVTETAMPTETVAKEEAIVMAQVPDVTGSAMFVTDAIDWLQGAGFPVELRSDSSSDAPRGTVVRQVPAAGVTGARGSIVRLTVANATNVDLSLTDDEKRRIGDATRGRIDDAFAARVEVPDFQESRADFVDAVLELQRLGLKANLDLPPNHIMPLAKIYGQNPAARTDVKPGDTVTLTIGASGVGPYAAPVSKLNRLTPENQSLVQDFFQRLEQRRTEINGPVMAVPVG
jgi:hypothetical protein